MKDSKTYSPKVHKLYRSLKRRFPKVQKVLYDEPVDAVIYAIVSENMSEKMAKSAIKKFDDYFVDSNELRVSQAEEIIEVLGEDTPVTRNIASVVIRVLRAVFDEYNTVSLSALKKIGKRPAMQILEKMDGTSRFTVNYCVLTSLQGHAMPLTKKMIEYLKTNQIVHPDADEQQIEGFLARQISAKNTYEFYALLRRCSEARKAAQNKKKTTAKKKTKVASKTKKQPRAKKKK